MEKTQSYPHHKKEPDPQEWIQTLYTIKESEIKATGRTQCKVHKWRKLSDNELECVNCPTAILCHIEDMDDLLKN